MGAEIPDRAFVMAALAVLVMAMAGGRGAEGGAVGRPPLGCTRMCGDKEVPYPFGLNNDTAGEDCYLLPIGYNLTCNYSYSPPKLFNGNIEIIAINISSAQMTILLNISYDCYTNSSGVPSEKSRWKTSFSSPYVLSYKDNMFMAVGCETLARFRNGEQSYGGCISGCTSLANVIDGECSGFGCCQTPIPPNIWYYRTSYYNRQKDSNTFTFNPCSYFFMVKRGNYTFHKSDLQEMDKERVFPVVQDWAIGRQEKLNCDEAKKNTSSYACVSDHSDCFESTNGPGYICNCSRGYQGNPYLRDGCTDIDECEKTRLYPELYPCKGICRNIGGDYECYCDKGYHSDDPRTQKCVRKGLPLRSMLAIGTVSGVVLLFIVSLICCLGIQRRKLMKLREKCFERNGGAFLQQAIASNRSSFKIFTVAELEKATDNFSQEQILGQGGFGTVYRGKLEDGRIVAIKRSMVVDEKNGQDFANELFILSEINHKNIVKLVGCCLDDEIPMLVYEFIAKGTLFSYIHSGQHQLPISFKTRVRIATEAAEALKYLHIDASPSILHGDVKSSNILLDENYTSKVSDFGTSTLAPKDKSQFTTFIQGTYGYLDPEYMINGCLTDKSDVFSFGVILAELLTRRMPFNFEAKVDKERSLAINFISCANSNKLEEILDPEITEEGVTDEVVKFVKITLQCLNVKGEDRPTMKEVLMELESVYGVERHPWVPYNTEEVEHLLGGAASSSQDTGTINRGFFGIEAGR